MFADYGFFLLLLCFILSIYGSIAAVVAAFGRHRRLWRSSRITLSITCGLALIASCILWHALFTHDYAIAYVFKNSSNDLPYFYRFTAFWCALEGSHLFWTLLLTIFSTVSLWSYHRDNEHIMPFVSASLQIVLAWMYYLAITYSDPFEKMGQAFTNGQGMNALLQNFYMTIHPPMLFVGYTALAIPAAYGIGALGHGDITQGWLKTVRRWTLLAWIFLTAAITLGGRWAYVELGWAGYWAWDPVENASLMPWLLATALLHCLLVQDRLGHLKRFSIILAFFAFFMSFLGTFITRSGVISSVHSFAQSPIGPNYLFFLGALLLGFCILFGVRSHSILPAETDKVWGYSKESALLMTQLLLLTSLAIVFVGTMFPIVSEAVIKQRISIQAPYFNTFAPYLGAGLVVAIAIGNLMRFQTPKIPNGRQIMTVAVAVAVPATVLLVWLGNVMQTTRLYALVAQIVGMYLISWSACCLTGDLYYRIKPFQGSLILFLRRNLAYTGAYIAHIGFLMAIFGFLGNYRTIEIKKTLNLTESASLYGYDLKFDGIKVLQEHNAKIYAAPLQVTKNGQVIGTVRPARSLYPTKPELLHEVGVFGSLWHDIYIVLADFDMKDMNRATFQIHINPTVRFVWIAVIIMCIGGIIAFGDRYRGERSRDMIAGEWNLK